MAYDEQLAERVRRIFVGRNVACDEKRMMGGLCFMVDGKMCVGVEKQRLMVRIDPNVYNDALRRKGCVSMDFTGRPMRGFVFVNKEGTASERALASWIDLDSLRRKARRFAQEIRGDPVLRYSLNLLLRIRSGPVREPGQTQFG